MIEFKDINQFVQNVFDQFQEIGFCACFDTSSGGFSVVRSRGEHIESDRLKNYCIEAIKAHTATVSYQESIEWESGAFLLLKKVSEYNYLVLTCAEQIFPMVHLYIKNVQYAPMKTKVAAPLQEDSGVIDDDVSVDMSAAQNIQKLILTEPKVLKEYFTDFELIYQPLEAIGGDFYFFEAREEFIYLVIGDCTGHGVEGALTSMTISSLIKMQLTGKQVDLSTAMQNIDTQIANYNLPTKNESGYGLGAEIALLEFNRNTHQLRGISSGLPVIRTDHEGLHVEKTRKKLLATPEYKSFEWQLTKGQCIYIHTDGISDQFGPDDRRKLGSRGVKEIMHTLYYETESPLCFQEKWNQWKMTTKQVDDATYLGLLV